MALKSKLNSSLNLSIHKGSVILTGWGETIGTITPEIFMEGWGKNTVDEALDGGKSDGLIPVGKSGPVGLKTRIQSSARNHKLKFELSPLSLVAVIHARIVLSLPYKDWTGAPYLLGQHCGFIPAKKSADPKIS